MAVVLPLLLLLLLGSSPAAHAAADDEHEYTVVAMSSLEPRAVCSGHRVTPPHNGSWVPLHRPHGPCSPSFKAGPGAAKPSMAELLRQDQLRVDDILSRLSHDYGESKARYKKKRPAVVTETQLHHQCTIEPSMGSDWSSSGSELPGRIDPTATGGGGRNLPGVVQTVVLDTASDVPWVQCLPCPSPPCPYYDPARSRTYAAFACNSPACRGLGPYAAGCSANNQCQYRVTSADGSFSSGTYSSDLLTLDGTNSIASFQFGCSRAQQGRFEPRAAGIMALGGGAESLAAQTAVSYGSAFSYCVPSTASDVGFFALGQQSPSTAFARTPMLRDPRNPTFYRVLLRGITVGGRRLAVPASAFAAGTVLDSRTVITRLPLTAYAALRAAFRARMRRYPRAPRRGGLDTCYDFTRVRRGSGVVSVPRVELVFDRNVVVKVHTSGILFNGCLAFAPNADDTSPGVLGNVQTQTIELLHDVGGGAVGFRTDAC